MKTEEEIKEKIKELRERKTHTLKQLKRTSTKDALILYNCIIALKWVLESEG